MGRLDDIQTTLKPLKKLKYICKTILWLALQIEDLTEDYVKISGP